MKIDYQLLAELGLSALSEDGKDSLLRHLVDRLELNVGTVIASQLNDEQIDEFEKLVDGQDQSAALSWLQQNYPDYKEVVKTELNKLKTEIKANAPAILAADQSDAAKPPADDTNSPSVAA